jgi:hypothetical protein
MKILAFSDIHGAYRRVDEILLQEQEYDAVILAGDLTTNGSVREAEVALHLFAKHAKPIFIVAGNMDPRALEAVFAQHAHLVDARGEIFHDVGIFGVSGSPPTPFLTPYEISEEEIALRAEAGWNQLLSARVKIFVPHPPPLNTNCDKLPFGKHVGSSAVRAFIEQYQPDMCVCGHIHEARGVDRIGKTHIVNCGPAGKGYYAVLTVAETVSIEVRG